MSISNEIDRITKNRNTIRNTLVSWGVGSSNNTLDQLAEKISNIPNQGGVQVQLQEGGSYVIPAGYHNGSGLIKAIGDGYNPDSFLVQAKTAIPTKEVNVIKPDTGFYALSTVTIEAIPSMYQDVSAVTATQGEVLASKIFVTADGTITTGTMENIGNVTVKLTANKLSYNIPTGYHAGGGQVYIDVKDAMVTPTKSTQILQQSESFYKHVTIQPIPPNYQDITILEENLDGIAADLSFTGSDGNLKQGTAEVQSGEFIWDYTTSDVFYITPGLYKEGEQSDFIAYDEWQLWNGIDSYYPDDNLVNNWKEIVIYDEDNNWIGPFPQENPNNGFYCQRAFVPPIPGNGRITTIGAFGISFTKPQGGFGGDDGYYYGAFLSNGTLYVAFYDESPNYQPEYLWIYDYYYANSEAYVTATGLENALAAI